MNMNSIPVHLIQGIVTLQSIKIPNRGNKKKTIVTQRKCNGTGEMVRLKGNIELSLLKLEFLNYLDLSGNNFDGIRNYFEDRNISVTVNLTGPQHNYAGNM